MNLDDYPFREDLLRKYLGKYESRFKSLKSAPTHTAHAAPMRNAAATETILYTEPHPLLVIQFASILISLVEYIEIEEEDPYYGAFDHYQIEIITVPLHDPNGFKKIEEAITRSYLTGTIS